MRWSAFHCCLKNHRKKPRPGMFQRYMSFDHPVQAINHATFQRLLLLPSHLLAYHSVLRVSAVADTSSVAASIQTGLVISQAQKGVDAQTD